MEVIIEKKAAKEIVKLPKQIIILFRLFLTDLQRDGLELQGWELGKMKGEGNTFRAKLNYRYRVIIEVRSPDLVIIKVSSREGAYK
jgi:mRNA-degrading endonuclease RelE of RelBE toxin-antitoxin system